ncbi:MAG: TetR family transcriptional regulator C-terminal domain-containing protein [Candidatus Hydrogenedentes bacterium]|nr:TetR family transcriptional regulator C-terminal domain-containing protein [Candidatus Hydrogenedentota bacterium]
MAHAISGEGSASKRLALIFQSLEESAAARPELVRAQIEFYTFAVRDQEFSAWFHRMYVDTIELLSSLIELAIEEGEFRRVDPAATARMLMAYMDGAFLHREMLSHHEVDTPGIAEMATTVIALLNKSENDDA